MTCWICHPGPCLTPDECGPVMPSVRQVMAAMPDLARFSARLNDPDFPTAQERADAERALAQNRINAQGQLPL